MQELPKLILSWLVLSTAGFSVVQGAERAWPEGMVIAENSASLDGRNGMLIPSRAAAEDLDEHEIVNAIVELKARRQLAVLDAAHYSRGFNHRGLDVQWAANSSWCAVTLPARFTAVKNEQLAWLKRLEARDSFEEKCELMSARVEELRVLLW